MDQKVSTGSTRSDPVEQIEECAAIHGNLFFQGETSTNEAVSCFSFRQNLHLVVVGGPGIVLMNVPYRDLLRGVMYHEVTRTIFWHKEVLQRRQKSIQSLRSVQDALLLPLLAEED